MADWFRWWHGTVTDTKFLWVSRKSGQRPGDVNAVWCALLEHASQSDIRGSIGGFDAESMDCFLDLDDGVTQRIIDTMRTKGMIDQDGCLTGWERRQPKREDSGGDEGGPMSNTERSRLSRANKRIEELEQRLAAIDMQRDETQCNATKRDETHATARGEERRGEEKEPSTSLSDAHEEIPPPTPTRKGLVCGLLRKAGMADAAPHYLTDDTWALILGKRTDEEIVELARAKMAAKPNERIGLKYLAPALLEDPQRIEANARASPGNRRQNVSDDRKAASMILTGRTPSHDKPTPSAERDITADCQRIA